MKIQSLEIKKKNKQKKKKKKNMQGSAGTLDNRKTTKHPILHKHIYEQTVCNLYIE